MNVDALDASAKLSVTAKIAWTVLIVATLCVCYFSHLGAIGFVGPDEPRYAWIARAMTETDDWVTPRLYGKPWFEKPPLYYWGAALSFRLFGVSEAAARLPSAISALLATLALAWLAWRVYGGETARWLLLLLPTTVGMIGFSHAAATDMPFSGTLTIAMVCAAVALRLTRTGSKLENSESCHSEGGVRPRNLLLRSFIAKSRFLASLGMTFTRSRETSRNAKADQGTPWLALILFGFFLGLAVLAKGPAAIILSGGAVFFWALFTKRWKDAFRLLHPVAIASFCATALPWYILCARRNPDFFRVFIIEHNFKRFLTPEFHHIQPFWYYAPILLVASVPWTPVLLWALAIGTHRTAKQREVSPATALLITWAAFCVLFFSVSHSKLPGYVLPAVPAIGLLLAHALIKFDARRTSLAVALLLGVLAFALTWSAATWGFPRAHISRAGLAGTAGLLILIIAAAGAMLIFRCFDRARALAAGCVLPVFLAVLLLPRFLAGYFLWDPSGRTIAQELRRTGTPISELMVYKMSRGQHYSLNFYMHEEIPEWDPNREPEALLLLMTDASYQKILMNPALEDVFWKYSWESLPFNSRATGEFLYRFKLLPPSKRESPIKLQ